ncbi:uncharacterized protein HGUI_01701 [Hanseniaspora guilliermondii]|uniref:DUF2470 domain-containing protein n=1 Tax=Hanseniaspora guilliermondii TaxID=56406 RepID=A0A1L0CKX0_9ASCO|nr:uncharacterized protein HGUI_01701 [Hanseniaspora guilliermondii]
MSMNVNKVKQIIKHSNENPNEHRIIINKLNTFHKHNIMDIISVYSKEYTDEHALSLSCLNISHFDESTITFTYARGVKDEAEIVIDTPYDFVNEDVSKKITNFADYFEQLSKHVSKIVGRYYKQVNSIRYPTHTISGLLLFLTIQIPLIITIVMMCTDIFDPIFQYMFFGASAKTVFMISSVVAVITLLIHVVEFIALKIPQKWNYYRLTTDMKIEHFIFCMLEGYPHHDRFNELIKNVKDSGFYTFDVETVDNIM